MLNSAIHFLKRKLRISIWLLFKETNASKRKKGNKERKQNVAVLLDLLLLL